MEKYSKSKNKWQSRQISKKFQKRRQSKPRINNAVYCPSIHLARTNFEFQDYEIINPSTETIQSSQNAIDCIDELIKKLSAPQPAKKIHIVHISDTHLSYNDYIIPFKPNMINILIHSGDLSHSGCLKTDGSIPKHFKQFNKWFTKLPHHKKVVIAGNHDVAFRQLGKNKVHSIIFHNDPNIIYLQDDMINLYGITIYGTPWTDKGAFKPTKNKGRCRKKESLNEKWKQIPDGLDILISHQHPSIFTMDGDEDLLDEVINRIQPKVHLFGHDHGHIGCKMHENIMFINSAMDKYQTPHVFDIVFDL